MRNLLNPTFENAFYAIVSLQLLIFALLRYFFFIPTNSLRWGIDAALYLLTLALLLMKMRLKYDNIFIIYIMLLVINLLGFSINSNELIPLLKQIRFTFMGGMVYILLRYGNFAKEYFERLIRMLFIIGYLQLPLVIIQLLFYKLVAIRHAESLPDYADYASGSIGYGESGVLGTFLVILAIVKIQQGFTYKFNRRLMLQLLLLLAPLGLINSDAQFIFLPIILLLALLINKINIKAFKFIFIGLAAFFLVNAMVEYNWEGKRNIIGVASGKINSMLSPKGYYLEGGRRLLRFDSMRYVWNEDSHDSFIIGKGPGYWLKKDSEGENSITNVWYHCNTVLLMYGELGIMGLLIFFLIPVVLFLETNNTFWGKTTKLLSFYIFLLLFYNDPLSTLSLVITLMIFIVYFRKFIYKQYYEGTLP